MKVILKADRRFLKDQKDNWFPSPRSGQGELFLKGQELEVSKECARLLKQEDSEAKPKDFAVYDKQITDSNTKVIRKKVNEKTLG